MTAGKIFLIAVGVAALALPAGALAQQYGERQDQGQYGDPYDGHNGSQNGDAYGSQNRDQYGSQDEDQYGTQNGEQYNGQDRQGNDRDEGYGRDQGYDRNQGFDRNQGYEQPPGAGSQDDQAEFSGYPEFRRSEAHIAHAIQEGLSDNSLHQNEAADLNGRLQRIRDHEMRVFHEHGWNLSDSDRAEIRQELDQLDRWVDEIRQES
jgi:hypothetical protein